MLRKKIARIAWIISLLASMQVAATGATFEEVDIYLEKGGVIYGIVDVEGDISNLSLKLEEMLQAMSKLNPQMAMVSSIPVSTLVDQTGMTGIRAIGISSTRREQGFENRTIILTEDGLPGLLGFYGRKNQPFLTPLMAPAGTDVAVETSMDTGLLMDVLRGMATSIMGENGSQIIDLYLGRPLGKSSFTAGELLEALQGQAILIMDVSELETMEIPKVGKFPKVDFMLQLQSAGGLTQKLADLLTQAGLPEFKTEANGDVITMSGFMPANSGYDFILQGNQASGELVLSSSTAFLATCQAGKGARLINSEAYQAATSGLSREGIYLCYMSPGVNRLMAKYIELVLQADGAKAEAMRPYMEWVMDGMMPDFPVASVLSIEENGLFTQSLMSTSHKRNLAALAYANPVTIGLMAAMAIPAFQKVRATSQQKAITNNLRQLASAAQQCMLEEGVMSVQTKDLIGPNAYISSFEPITGEAYPEVITAEMIEIQAVLPNGETVSYQF